MAEPLLRFDQVAFAWDAAHPLFDRLSFDISSNECVALVGRNGAGKSTLFQLACGLQRPSTGRVLLSGLDTATARAPQRAGRVSLMFQEAERQICQDRIAAEVGFAPRIAGHNLAEIRRRVAHALDVTGLAGREDEHPLDLNAGERRMLTLASLIAQDTPLVLLDEPTRDFDAPLLERFEAWMASALREGRSIFFISHDLDFVARHATRVLHLSDEGIVADGAAESVLRHPALQDTSAMAAPTLVALCRALGMSVTTSLETFAQQWRSRFES